MDRQLSEAVVGDVFRFDPNLIRPGTPLSTGYIIVTYVSRNRDLVIINAFNINSDTINGETGDAQTNGLIDQNTTFVEHIPQGPIAMAASRRRKSRISKRFRKSRRKR
jgi:hypothetical protein